MDIAALDRWAVQGESPWHRAAPLAKIGATALFIAAVVMSHSVAALVTLYLALAALMAVARLPLRRVLVIAAYPALFAVLFDQPVGWNLASACHHHPESGGRGHGDGSPHHHHALP